MSCLRSMRLARRTTASSARSIMRMETNHSGIRSFLCDALGWQKSSGNAGSPRIVRIIAPCWQSPAMAGAQLSIKREARTLGGGLFPIRVISNVRTSYQSGRQCGLFYDPMYPKPAITISRKDWYSAANRAVLSPLQTDAPSHSASPAAWPRGGCGDGGGK